MPKGRMPHSHGRASVVGRSRVTAGHGSRLAQLDLQLGISGDALGTNAAHSPLRRTTDTPHPV